jgi:hypothetical protein
VGFVKDVDVRTGSLHVNIRRELALQHKHRLDHREGSMHAIHPDHAPDHSTAFSTPTSNTCSITLAYPIIHLLAHPLSLPGMLSVGWNGTRCGMGMDYMGTGLSHPF